jgi:hypothetical protein
MALVVLVYLERLFCDDRGQGVVVAVCGRAVAGYGSRLVGHWDVEF